MSTEGSPVSKKQKLDNVVTKSTTGGPAAEKLVMTPDLTEFEQRILSLTKQSPKGLSNKIIQHDSPNVSGEERAAAINNLLAQGLLDLYKQGNELLYKLKFDTGEPAEMKGADQEEKVVYDIIGTAGNKGIWMRDIRFKSNLTMPQLNKILKALETKRLIKTVKSVAASKKKVYMLFDLEPDRSLTGGAFYSDQDFEGEFVAVLTQQCLRYLRTKRDTAKLKKSEVGPMAARYMASATLQEISEFIKNLGISKVELSQSDIESLLNTLTYDDSVDVLVKGETKMYYSRQPFGRVMGVDSMPCGVCPVFRDCSEDGPINPRSCVYMTKWIENESYEF